MDLFVYGTLMVPRVFARCGGGGEPVMESAVLRGHARYRVAGEVWPGVVPEEGGVVEGMLVRGVGGAVMRRLEVFEGGDYELVECVVECGGEEVGAVFFRLREGARHVLSDEGWTLEEYGGEAARRFGGQG
jgi:gamma-glutamylcyclotransferase (GGCT)/AIG2-like uncharacterized protein YtfP